jgi:hypothetical protein
LDKDYLSWFPKGIRFTFTDYLGLRSQIATSNNRAEGVSRQFRPNIKELSNLRPQTVTSSWGGQKIVRIFDVIQSLLNLPVILKRKTGRIGFIPPP